MNTIFAFQVLVTLQDVNDCIPEFKSPAVIGVTENTNLTTVVHTVVVHDCDAGANADLTFSIASKSGPVSPFTIGTSDGRLRVNTNLDRETTQNYTMVVTVRDHGNPPLSSTQDLVVNIEDENDHSPVFSQTTYLARVSEDVAINVGQILLKVTATDQDVGVNGMVRYFVLSGDENQDFSLDQSSGALRVQKKLDYERVSSYKLFVRAEDRGSIVRFAAATVSITVDDVNDNEPVFLDSPYVKYVRENMDRPVFVLQVSAKDADSAPFNQLQYKIQSGDLSLFNISQTTGQIMALQSLDRERALSYVLTVVATDSGEFI
ncbi:hypothetical protein DPMN_116234 [Dreissena polymorpha]|uniref:Cadherin domain-containing protein n=1 Tax=Dreissena polymorpha TaxID=45954 RepID=A0A9D4QUJ7_DREPO|nr:hypothetical protein DPMN_116234 [Dreissena polymorpha]